MGGFRVEPCGSGQGLVACCCDHGNVVSGSIKHTEFIEFLRNYEVIKNNSTPWSELDSPNNGKVKDIKVHHSKGQVQFTIE
jgi:hypothetical protein